MEMLVESHGLFLRGSGRGELHGAAGSWGIALVQEIKRTKTTHAQPWPWRQRS